MPARISARPLSACVTRITVLRHNSLQRQVSRPGPAAIRPRAALSADSLAQTTSGNGSPALAQSAAPAALVVPPEGSAPPETYQKVVEAGATKAQMSVGRTAFMALVAGAYISFGALLLCSVGATCTGLGAANPGLQKLVMAAFGLQYGLIMVIICGAELFTGNTMFMAAAFWEGKATPRQVAKSWVVSYLGNLVGCLAMVAAVAAAGIFTGGGAAVNIAVAKTSLSFGQAFTRAILANWLVCIAIWMATSASSVPGKILGAYFPILTFVGIGLEHSVANMFFIPMGIVLGAPVTWKAFFLANLLPVTLGNIIGGAICMGTVYAVIFGKLNPDAKTA